LLIAPAYYYRRAVGLASRLPAALDLPDLGILGVAGEERGGAEPARPGGLAAGFAAVADASPGRGRGRPVRADLVAVAVNEGIAQCGTLPGQGPRQALDEVGEIIAADRMVERAGAVGE
jgi:hypothetical protein